MFRSILPNLILLLCLHPLLFAQQQSERPAQTAPANNEKNFLHVQLNHHLERRGSDRYQASNPDFALAYERVLFASGKHAVLAGARTGVYDEYVLTGDGWSHPVKTRFFLGLTPSYRYRIWENIYVQVNFLYDVLLPNDYDEIWSYWAVQPSLQLHRKRLYAGISATTGVFLFFDPKAYMDKAGIQVGIRF